jgi:Na+/melibiose symporter-like transporter
MMRNKAQSLKPNKTHSPFLLRAVLFSLPQLGLVALFAPTAILAGLYAKYFGMSLTEVAGVILVAKLFDAVTDPLIGYWSDFLYAKTGSRKSLVLLGGLLLIPCSGFLFIPVFEGSAVYFFFWYILFYLAYTLILISYMAWANELAADTREKTMIFSAINMMGYFGSIFFYLLPLLPYFMSAEITPEILKYNFLVGSALMLVGLYLVIKYIPSGLQARKRSNASTDPSVTSRASDKEAEKPIKEVIISVLRNKPFLILCCIFLMIGMAVGMWLTLFFTYVDSYLRQGEVFTKVYAWSMAAGGLMIPIWYHLVLRWSKRSVWLLSTGTASIVYISCAFLNPSIAGFTLIFTLKLIYSVASSAGGVIAGPLLCDAIDYACLKEGTDRSGLYFSLQGLLFKIPGAVGAGLGFAIIGAMGYDATSNIQTEWALLGMRIGVAWLPALFMLLSMILIAMLPLSERRMVVIRRRLQQRSARAAIP